MFKSLFILFLITGAVFAVLGKLGLANPAFYNILVRSKDFPQDIKKMGFLDALFVLLFGDKYKKNPKGSKLTDGEKRALYMGEVLVEQNGAYYDTFETGVWKGKLYTMLSEWYGINSKETAHDTMLRFLNEGHNKEYSFIKKYVVENNEAEFAQTPETNDVDRRYYEFFVNLSEAVEVLVTEKVISKKEDLLKIDAYAWDAGRIAYISRACAEMGFLTEKEAWSYIMEAYNKSKAVYKNWEDFGQGYVVGRAMWGGNNGSLGGIININKELLADENSPWKEVSFM